MHFSEKFRNHIVFSLLFIYLAGFNFIVYGAVELDPTFNGSIAEYSRAQINVVKTQPDGKILAGGYFTDANGVAASGITRLNPDGSVDPSFKAPDFFDQRGVGREVFAIALQADGKILVGGTFLGPGEFKAGVRRLNADGSFDASFPITELPLVSTVYDIEIQPDGKILVGGTFPIFRLNSDGTPDNSFSSSVNFSVIFPLKEIELQPDGKILIGGGQLASPGYLGRLNSNGSSDSSFSTSSVQGTIEAIKLRPDGKVLIGGGITFGGNNASRKIALVDSSGVPDETFNTPIGDGLVNRIFLKPDGKIIISGSFLTLNEVSRKNLVQLNADGSLDNSVLLDSPETETIPGLYVYPDGKILRGVVGGITAVSRINGDGSADSTFAPPFFGLSGIINRIQPLPDGKILASGSFVFASGAIVNSLIRFNANGTIDNSFNPFWNAVPNPTWMIRAFAVQADGKVLVARDSAGLVRLNPDGSLDPTFPFSGGGYSELVYLPDGKFLVGAVETLYKLNPNGELDNSFSPKQTNGRIRKITVLPDGKILFAGEFSSVQSQSVPSGVARVNANGTLDPTFIPPLANNKVYAMDRQADGKIIIGGIFTTLNGNGNYNRIARLNADGSLDTSFVQSANGPVNTVKALPDGKILIGGAMSTVQGVPRNGIARLNADGTLDTSFTTHANMPVQTISLQADGKILIGGLFTKINQQSAVRIARLLNSTAPPRTPFDYDGDGKSDVSVFRPSENRWYILRSFDAGIIQTFFGAAGDIPAPADYDGDGKTDLAVWRPSTGAWWYLSSLSGAQLSVNWGQAGDLPRPSDFDGDGKTDFVVYRPSNGVWYRLGSGGQTSILAFGTAGDKPLVGDFDGDGKSDPAVFRPSTGDWWYAASASGQFLAVHWGQAGDIPVPGDYDGDGKADFVVFRPSDGGWYILYTSGSYTIATFGTVGDVPIAADYDGDGKADIAVFRPSQGIWYLLQTTAGFGALQWGVSTDIPTESAFIP
jgi:uncharacterized delta-60 repeat protein